MKKFAKRLLSVALSLFIVMSVIPTAFAAENPNLLLGASYTHDVTNWYDDRADDTNCTFLTDGVKGGNFYGSDYFGGYNTAATIVFDFDEVIEFAELQMQFFYNEDAGVTYPPSMTVSVKEDDASDYVAIFQGAVTASNFVLGSDTETFTAKSLKFELPNMQFLFIKEIEAYAQRNEIDVNGTLEVVEEIENLALGRKYTSSMAAGSWYNANTTDADYRLTNGTYGSLSSYNNTEWAGWLNSSSVTIDFDLGCLSKIYEVNTRNFNTEMHGITSAGKYEVYASKDGIVWDEIYVNSAVHGLEWMEYQAEDPFSARFIRVIISQGNSNFIFLDEVEIIGVGGKEVAEEPDESTVTNQAEGKPYTVEALGIGGTTVLADVTEADMPDKALTVLTDGNTNKYVGWNLGNNTSAEVTVQLNLLSSKALYSVTANFNENLPSDMKVYVADTIVNGKANWIYMGAQSVNSAAVTYTFDDEYKAQYVKLVFTQVSDNMGIAEIEVTGKGDVTNAVDPAAGLFERLDNLTSIATYRTSTVAEGYADDGNLTDNALDNFVGFDHLAGVTRYVKLDLGGVYETNAFNAVFSKDYLPTEITVLVSEDGENWKLVRAYASTEIATDGDTFVVDYILGEGVDAQFVMFSFYKASGITALSEVAVYGNATKLADGVALPTSYLMPGEDTSYVSDAILLDTDTALQYIDMIIDCGFDGVILDGSVDKEAAVLEALNSKATATIKVYCATDLSGYANLEIDEFDAEVSEDLADAKLNSKGVFIKSTSFADHLLTMDELVEGNAQGRYVYKLYKLDVTNFTDAQIAKVFENYAKLIKGTLKLSNNATPVAPVVESFAGNWINLTAVDGYEYSIDGVNWGKDTLFINLETDTEYTLYQRVAETAEKEGSVYAVLTTSTSSELGAKVPVMEKDLPAELVMYKGKYFTLEVEAVTDDDGVLTYQWYKDDVAIDGANGNAYTIKTPSEETAGAYKVVVTNTFNGTSARTNSATCNVVLSDDNINLLKGMAYTHDVTTWHNTTSNEPGNSLTDGVYGSGWGSGNYLDAYQYTANVEFDLGTPMQFKELDLYTYARNSGIAAPNVSILIKENADADWVEIYSGTTDNGETLDQHTAYVSEEPIVATNLKFAFAVPSGENSMIFVREIEMYNEATGYKAFASMSLEGGEVLPDDTTYTVSGNVTAFGDTDKDVTVELVSGSTVVATKTVTGTSGSYTFEDVDAGTYTVKVSKTKHATREYEVTVSDAVTQDVEIWLYGDVTGDGNINNVDILHMNRYIANMTSAITTDTDYRFKVANITAISGTDTIINNIDTLHIERMLVNMTSAFDSLA